MVLPTTPQSIDPTKIEGEVTKPKSLAPDIQHKIVTDEIKKPKQPNYANQSQSTQRKAAKRKARAVKNVNLSDIAINSSTIKGQFKKLDRKVKCQLIKDGIKRRQTLKSKTDYVKNPSRNLGEDINGFWTSLKETGKRFNEGTKFTVKTKKLLEKKWIRRGFYGIGVTLAFNLIRDKVSRAFQSPRAIPDEYEKGYDIISETLTDFGSPVSIAKAAQKVIVPYYSTVRSSLRTNVNTIVNHNYALAASKHAIRHNQY